MNKKENVQKVKVKYPQVRAILKSCWRSGYLTAKDDLENENKDGKDFSSYYEELEAMIDASLEPDKYTSPYDNWRFGLITALLVIGLIIAFTLV